MGRMLSPSISSPKEVPVHKLMSLAMTTLLTLSALICLVLAASADGVGPG
jgi:hypothetical protein